MSDPVTPLTPEQLAAQEAKVARENYLHRTLVGMDQAANVLLDGQPDETISARSARADEAGRTWGRWMSRFLDFFQRNHGPKAQAGDLERAEAVEAAEEESGGFRSDGNR